MNLIRQQGVNVSECVSISGTQISADLICVHIFRSWQDMSAQLR